MEIADGKLYIDLRKFNQCDIAFKNTKNENVYINVVDNCIYVYVTNSFGKEEVIYEKTNDGVNVSFNSFRKFLILKELSTE